jgi:2-dehydrotetronate isomerase
MPRFAANLTMMFNEYPFADRFAAAADAGFTEVECLFPYELDCDQVAKRLDEHGLKLVLFNMPPGNWEKGDRGLAIFPDRRDELRAGLATALRYAAATRVPRLHLMAGIGSRGDAAQVASYREGVRICAEALGAQGLELVLEPINTRSMPGYFLDDFGWTADLIRDLGLPNLMMQFDIFHRQILHGDVAVTMREWVSIIGHVQIASVPDRHEPDEGELNYPFLFSELDRIGYDGSVGCEYRPRGVTKEGLSWFAPWRRR